MRTSQAPPKLVISRIGRPPWGKLLFGGAYLEGALSRTALEVSIAVVK
jgi:hypothetical protein